MTTLTHADLLAAPLYADGGKRTLRDPAWPRGLVLDCNGRKAWRVRTRKAPGSRRGPSQWPLQADYV